MRLREDGRYAEDETFGTGTLHGDCPGIDDGDQTIAGHITGISRDRLAIAWMGGAETMLTRCTDPNMSNR
ncbi:hypothetical protein FHT00_003338 [Sphingomonas insulae]|uniref:Uncharacterized protein n=1 Tax=Sphingomonas insulae TaxID=424800 RepID=A0ABN1HQ63_9SPHN|nr:hypothetical protein [Sphingomonas insulae]